MDEFIPNAKFRETDLDYDEKAKEFLDLMQVEREIQKKIINLQIQLFHCPESRFSGYCMDMDCRYYHTHEEKQKKEEKQTSQDWFFFGRELNQLNIFPKEISSLVRNFCLDKQKTELLPFQFMYQDNRFSDLNFGPYTVKESLLLVPKKSRSLCCSRPYKFTKQILQNKNLWNKIFNPCCFYCREEDKKLMSILLKPKHGYRVLAMIQFCESCFKKQYGFIPRKNKLINEYLDPNIPVFDIWFKENQLEILITYQTRHDFICFHHHINK